MALFRHNEADCPEDEGELILGRYRVLGEAGAGGFGTVQAAWDTRMQRRVAVKVIDLSPIAQAGQVLDDVDDLPSYAVTGLEEARTAAMLNNPNIVTVHDFEVQDNLAYLIMEFVDGITLTELLGLAGDTMTVDMVTAVFDGVASALRFAHQNQVLHLDIKPDNVMIDHQGQVKVMDFGLARLSSAQGFASAAGGTIGYMPPEQIMQESLDVRCDEWALASLTYEMISGKNPFLAKDLSGAINCIEGAEIVLPSLCMEGIAPEIDDVLFYALDPDRTKRYASVADFSEEMDRFLGSAPAGRKQLSMMVSSNLSEGALAAEGAVGGTAGGVGGGAEFVESRHTPLAGRFNKNIGMLILRGLSAANAGVLTFAGLMSIGILGGWSNPAVWGGTTAAVILGAAVPWAGALLGLGSIIAALAYGRAFILAAIVLMAAILWVPTLARENLPGAVSGLSIGSAGAVGLSQFVPLFSAYLLPPGRALLSVLFAALLAVVLGSCGSHSIVGWAVPLGSVDAEVVQHNALMLLVNPSTWIVVASWVLAVLVGSACCQSRRRAVEVLGMLLATAILVGGSFLVGFVNSGFAQWSNPDLGLLVPALVAFALSLALILLAHRIAEEGRIFRSLSDE